VIPGRGRKRIDTNGKPGQPGPCEILVVADHVDPLIYNGSIKERFSRTDIVLSCGDLNPEYYDFIVTSLNIPFFYVLGNHSSFTLKKDLTPHNSSWINKPMKTFQGGILLEGKVFYLKKWDLIIGGLGGSRRYNKGDNQYTEGEMFLRILSMLPRLWWNRIFRGRYLDIFVTHASPRKVNDREDTCHQGFSVFRWFLRRFRPRYQLHGHIHIYDANEERRVRYADTEVINCYDHYELKWGGPNESRAADQEDDRNF